MKDYSRLLDCNPYVKHYDVVDKQISVKYAIDEVSEFPYSLHNVEKLNRMLEEQLKKLNTKVKPTIEKTVKLDAFLATLQGGLMVELVLDLYKKSSPSAFVTGFFVFVLSNQMIINGTRISTKLKMLVDIQDMNDIQLFPPLEEISGLQLSELAEEVLKEDGNITLNNCESFTHQDIRKIKQYVKKRGCEQK